MGFPPPTRDPPGANDLAPDLVLIFEESLRTRPLPSDALGHSGAVLVNGKVVYSMAGWIVATHPGACGLCGADFQAGAEIVRVSAHVSGGNWASTCCAAKAEEMSGYWERFPNAPRRSTR